MIYSTLENEINTFGKKFEIIGVPLKGGSFNAGLNFEYIVQPHVLEGTLLLKFKERETVVYAVDYIFSEKVLEFMKDTDILIHEAYGKAIHTSLEDIKKIIQKVNPRLVIFTHGKFEKFRRLMNEIESTNVITAAPGMVVKF